MTTHMYNFNNFDIFIIINQQKCCIWTESFLDDKQDTFFQFSYDFSKITLDNRKLITNDRLWINIRYT
jgi:hypothetical protein